MPGVLTVSSSASPFPYAAVATATYTQKAEVKFDGTASGISLEVNGSTIASEDEIVRALAKEAGLADDSAKVRDETCLKAARSLMCALRVLDPVFLRAREEAPNSHRIPRARGRP